MRRLLLLLAFLLCGSPLFAQSHVYWRTYITNSSQVVLCQIQFLTAGGSVISTSGATITQSSGTGSTAFNGTTNCSTSWVASTGNNEWVEVQFASATTVDHLAIICCGTGFGAGWGPQNLALQYSDNNSTWTTQNTWNGLYQNTASTTTFTLTTSNAAPNSLGIAWRVYVSSYSGCIGFSDLAFYTGAGGSGAISTTSYSALASSIANGQVGAELPFAVANTPWYSNNSGGPGYIEYQFPTVRTIGSFSLSEQNNNSCNKPTSFSIQYSYDNSTWTTANSYTTAWPTNASQTFNVTGGPVSTVGGLSVIVVGP